MIDMRRTLLWVVFTMSLVLLWDAWHKHHGQPTLFGVPVAASSAAPAASATGAASAAAPGVPVTSASGAATPAVTASAGTAGAAAGLPMPTPNPGEQMLISTDVLKVRLDSRGGSVSQVELLKYPDHAAPDGHVILMDESAGRTYLAQTGFIGINPANQAPLPNHFMMLAAQPGERVLKDGADSLSVRFESPVADGLQWVKTLTFHRGRYTVDVKNELFNHGPAPLAAQIYLQLQRDGKPPAGESSMYFTYTGPALYSDSGKFQKVDFKDIEKRAPDEAPKHVTQADDGWIAIVQHYFASAWLVNAPGARHFITKKDGANLYAIAMVQPLGVVAPGASRAHEAQLYVGPEDEKKLATLAPGLDLVKDYGWLTILAKPLFWVLDKLYRLIGNWGWAIVGLVVLLKIAFYWLNASAYKSMAKMRGLSPRLAELRESYKDKPQEMQAEMMRIYREEKVNPLGGCLPIFVQMPFFIALYWVLLGSVEMRGAPWIGWIHDLSAKDPLYILPLLMTASSMFQVWISPKAPDPTQQKMMWIMPLMFSVMFFMFPSGLVLYWLTNNILSIAQQWYINRKLGVA